MSNCKDCGLDLEDWEVGLICEGCADSLESRWNQGSSSDREDE